MKNHYNNLQNQTGATLIVLAVVLVLVSTSIFFSELNANNIKVARDKKTAAVLNEAKKALLSYASTVYIGAACTSISSCRRPGDLPCPDLNNDGISDSCLGNALGRLPWVTLGLNDLRDGDNERLWYAVSTNFKNNPRIGRLNSDTLGTINVTNQNNKVVNNAVSSTGAVAVIISSGAPLTRQDGVQQSRSSLNQNLSTHYLDIALGEDNANFVDSNANGFVKGVIRDLNGVVILNDQLMEISRIELLNAIEPRIAAEIKKAILDYYNVYHYYPYPAVFSDSTCLG
ncbi:MAG: hypothetical protein H0W85_04275, partial [Methylotenera sp.]|nr:hypothetical protein [Methylotenera sp.]